MTAIDNAISNILNDYQNARPIDDPSHSCSDLARAHKLVDAWMPVVFPMLGQCDPAADLNKAVALLKPQLSEETLLSFLEAIPQLRATIQTDVDAAFDGDPAAFDHREIILCYPGIFAIATYRLAHILYGLAVPRLPRMMTEYAHSRTGIDIHPGAQIGSHFFIDHGTGIVIGETTVIGSHAKIYQGVTLGGISTRGGQRLKGKKRHPTLGDHVTVYANASILGGDTVVGHHCTIGASAFITDSIPEFTTVTSKCQALQLRSITAEPAPDRE